MLFFKLQDWVLERIFMDGRWGQFLLIPSPTADLQHLPHTVPEWPLSPRSILGCSGMVEVRKSCSIDITDESKQLVGI